MHNSPRIAMFSAAIACSIVYGCGKQDHHSGPNAIFPLEGKHAGLPCQECHGPSTGCNGNPNEKPPSTSCEISMSLSCSTCTISIPIPPIGLPSDTGACSRTSPE